jgi:hypothetical protein
VLSGAGNRWHTICVSYYDESAKDALILDAVRPLFAELSEVTGAAYFLRHWRRGPHLRLNVRTTEKCLSDNVLPAVDRIVGGYLMAHPSQRALDLAALLPEHRRLAELEREPGPLWPPRPDNVVCLEEYDSRAEVLGGERAAELVENHYTATNPAAFAALEAIRAEGRRLWTAFELMAATAHVFGNGVSFGFVSFRAHAENFLSGPDGPALRAKWDNGFRTLRPVLQARLAAVVEDPGATPARRRWIEALSRIGDVAELTMPQAPRGGEPPEYASPFVRALAADDNFHRHVLPLPAFRRYRLRLNLLYLHLTRLGIRPVDRLMLGHLLANTVESAYGVDALALALTNAAQVANRRPRAGAGRTGAPA